MKVISYYTKKYEGEASTLIESLKRFSMDHCVEERPSLGTWHENVRYKPEFILEKLKENDSVVWMDSDCAVVQEPTLLFEIDPSVDIALHIHPAVEDNKRIIYEAGVTYFRNTPRMIAFLEKLIQFIKSEEYLGGTGYRKGDQNALTQMLLKERKCDQNALAHLIVQERSLKILNLPVEYNCFPYFIARDPKIKPVITHAMASRIHNRGGK